MPVMEQGKNEDLLTRALLFFAAVIIFFVFAICLSLNSIKYLLPIIVVLGDLFVGVFVYLKGRRGRINRSYCLASIIAAVWAFSVFMYSDASSPEAALMWTRIATAASSAFPAVFLYFTSIFPREEKTPGKTAILVTSCVAIIFTLISFTDLLVGGVAQNVRGFQFFPGTGYFYYIVYFVGFMGYAFYQLLSKQFAYTGISRMQIRYVFLGFFIGFIFPVVTNILLPLFGIGDFSGYGPLATIVTIGFIAYAIIRHRLMSIELVVQRGIIYTLVTAFIIAIYAFAIVLSEWLFREAVGYSSFIVTCIAAIIIAVLYQPILRFLQVATDRLFFRGRYDYQKTLMQASSAIASLIKLDQLTKLIVSTFIETMAVSEISFLLFDEQRRRYRSASVELTGASRYRKIEIDERSPVVAYLKKTRETLVKDELESRIQRSQSPDELSALNELQEELLRVDVPLWVPIILKDELLGIIASGNKISGDVFTAEDLGLLSTLANQTAVALENTRLYEEIVSVKTYNEDILKSMTNGVISTDLKGSVVVFNAMAEKITGYSQADVIGKFASEMWRGGILCNVIDGTLRGTNYSNYEAGLVRKDGGVIPISVSTTLLKDIAGKSFGVLLVAADLSAVKELENKVRQADKLVALGTMAAGMAHEIKNPLSSMKVLSQLFEKKYDDPEFRTKFQEIMPREIGRIDRIVESLLGFAKATAPKFELLNMKTLIEETLKLFDDNIERNGIKVSRDFAPVPDIIGDPGQLSQVFTNLILNAIQAMSKGGELKLSVREGKKREGVLENIVVEVSDTGHGIPSDYLKKLFDPFFTTKHGGTGLGLTIVHSIIDGHRGSIDVSSEMGKGTAFIVTLPLAQ